MKIVSTGKTLASPEFHKKKVKARKKRLIVGSSVFFILLLGFIFVSRIEGLRIKDVTVTGADVISADDVGNIVRESLDGYYLWVIPRNNTLLYSEDKLERDLHREFPRFSSIKISISSSKALNVEVVEREPVALFCGDGGQSVCFFLDEDGLVFDVAPVFSGGVYFVYISDEASSDPLGTPLMSKEKFQLMRNFLGSLEEFGVEPLSLEMLKGDRILSLDTGAKILWKADSDLAGIFQNLNSFLETPEIKNRADFWSQVLMLDLRTEDKVFYKFKN